MPGFQRRAWGGNTTQNSQWSVGIKSSSYDENGNFILKLKGLKFDDVKKIANLDPAVFNVTTKEENNNTTVVLSVLKDKIDEFFNSGIAKITQALSATGNYTPESLKNFYDNVEEQHDLVPNPDEIAANDVVIAQNWKDMAKRLNDPEVRKRLLAFQTTNVYKNEFGGEPLSPRNVTEILMKDPMASFVTSAAQWRRWNRSIQVGADFVIYNKIEFPSISQKYLDQDSVCQQEGGWQNVVKKYGFNSQVAFGIRKRTAKRLKLSIPTFKVKGYDVRFTVPPTDPNDDVFMKMAGLANNMTGELNQVAKDILTQRARDNGEEVPDFDKKVEGAERKDLIGLKNYFIKKCKKNGITIDDTHGTTEDIIVDAIYQYAYSEAEKANKLTPENKNLFTAVVVSALAASLNLQSPRVSACANILKKFNEEEFNQISMVTFEVYRDLSNAIYNARNTQQEMNESVGNGVHIMDQNEFSNFIKNQLGGPSELEEITNNFNSFMERMNNSGKDDLGNNREIA